MFVFRAREAYLGMLDQLVREDFPAREDQLELMENRANRFSIFKYLILLCTYVRVFCVEKTKQVSH